MNFLLNEDNRLQHHLMLHKGRMRYGRNERRRRKEVKKHSLSDGMLENVDLRQVLPSISVFHMSHLFQPNQVLILEDCVQSTLIFQQTQPWYLISFMVVRNHTGSV